MDDLSIECDLLVVGGGMAGMSAAAWAAERGAVVIVVEKAAATGGSAVLSGGVLWTASSAEKMRRYGAGDPALGQVVFDTYPDAVAWLRRCGVGMSLRMDVLHGQGYQIDIHGWIQHCQSLVEQHGGSVILETETLELIRDGTGAVTGARTRHEDGDVTVHAKATVLATGGFQASSELRARYIHPNARDMLLRSNPVSDGAGLRLGAEAGGEVAGTNRGFYGHLVSEPNRWDDERLFVALSQYHSEHALLLNEAGERFCDETLGDHTNTYETLVQSGSRALCVWDARVHEAYATVPVVSIGVPLDKMQTAIENGGKGVVAETVEAIGEFAQRQGFDGPAVQAAIETFNRTLREGWETLSPPRTEDWRPIDKAPFYALVVHPAITFTFGGLTIDAGGHVLTPQGARVPGLFAAGADAGGAYGHGYAGGLALAMTFGITAARSAGWA
ncbi:MAG: FAD-binding dehydrogenase [Brevundimonas sp.]|uniref:FAD-binding protein n=1 Tax=Brevundimonas albigilva TaxID=1312364 RepID=A0ABY4SKF8_9CAUL|nr:MULTISPECIES: FAD-binding protein [Brevundimonas]PZU62068.1 MAG: FAD-binding dehydrogenase [Brevundimonas sp.]URI14728.1 FAD-binding protein [Brevundimonas albigilva]